MAVSITKRKTGSGAVRYRAQVRVPGHDHISKTFGRKKAAVERNHEPDERSRSPATINRYHSSIGGVFVQAHKKWHWMSSNPAREVLRNEESKGRVRWLSDDERDALLDSCKASKWEGLYPLVLLALATGARQGELIGLKWDQVDLKKGTRLPRYNQERRAPYTAHQRACS